MSEIVIETLRRELKKKQKQIERLEARMSERHMRKETAQAMDGFAHRFNNAPTSKEKLKIAEEMKATSDMWQAQCAKAKHQNKNYTKWMDRQSELQQEAMDLSSQIGMLEIRSSLRNR